jgi:hypothetical protein
MRFSRQALLSRIGNDEGIEETVSLEVAGAKESVDREEKDTFYSATDPGGVLYVGQIRIELTDYRPGVEEAMIGTEFKIG